MEEQVQRPVEDLPNRTKADCILAQMQKGFDLHPSLASLGDGLPSSAGSQRDEAKMQAPALTRV